MRKISTFLLTAATLLSGVLQAGEKRVLFLAYEGISLRHLAAPQVKDFLEEAGFTVVERYLSDITPELLREFDVAVVLYESLTESVNTAEEPGREIGGHIDELTAFVENGGGLFLFFTEGRYTDDFEPRLNQLIKPWGAQVWLETFRESNADNIHYFTLQHPDYYYSFQTTNLNQAHPISANLKSFWLSHMVRGLEVDDNWRVLVRGEESVRGGKSAEAAPPFMAVREVGKGRVLLFSACPSHYFNDGYHLFYEHGQLMESGDTKQLLLNALIYLAEHSPRDRSAHRDFPPLANRGGIIIRKSDKLLNLKPLKGVFGLKSNYSGGAYTVAQYALKARRIGLDFIVFTDEIDDPNTWEQFKRECAASDSPALAVIPGVEWDDQSGSTGYAANIAVWPAQTRIPAFIFPFLETSGADHRGIYVFGDPRSNAASPWNTGGFNALAAVTKKNGRTRHFALDVLEQLQVQSGMSVLPVVMDEIWTPEQLEESAANGFSSYLLAPALEKLRQTITTDLIPGFIGSNDMVLERFECAQLKNDPWENYIIWQPGDVIEIELAIRSRDPLSEVTLYSGSRIIRKFYPDGTRFEAAVPVVMVEDGPLWVTASDRNDGKLYSYALPTRNLNYWNHVGSDRMNDYHNPICPDPHGEISYNGELYGFGGLVTFAMGWGNYLRFYHPAPAYRYHPLGYETGQITAGLDTLDTYPRLAGNHTPKGQVEPQRTQVLAGRDVVIVEEKFPKVRIDKEFNLKEFRDIDDMDANTRITIYRYDYQPYGYIIVHGVTHFTALSDLKISDVFGQDFALNLLNVCFKGTGKDFRTSRYRDIDGVEHSVPVPESVKDRLGTGSWAFFTPDPYGLLGLYILDGDAEVMMTPGGNAPPQIKLGISMDNGTTVPRGWSKRLEWLVIQAGGGESPDEIADFAPLFGIGRQPGAPQYAPTVSRGKLLPVPYVVTLESDRGGAEVDFDCDIGAIPNHLIPMEVRNIPRGSSAGALNLATGQWYPGAVRDQVLHLALTENGKYFVGGLLSSSDSELQLDILRVENGIAEALVNNLSEQEKTVTISNHFSGRTRETTLAPGELRTIEL